VRVCAGACVCVCEQVNIYTNISIRMLLGSVMGIIWSVCVMETRQKVRSAIYIYNTNYTKTHT